MSKLSFLATVLRSLGVPTLHEPQVESTGQVHRIKEIVHVYPVTLVIKVFNQLHNGVMCLLANARIHYEVEFVAGKSLCSNDHLDAVPLWLMWVKNLEGEDPLPWHPSLIDGEAISLSGTYTAWDLSLV